MYNTLLEATKYAGQELEWFGSDSKHRFETNLKNNADALNRTGCFSKQITYKFNSVGFRCAEFSQDNNIMFLGCSHTFGLGIPVDTSWPSIVSSKLGMNNVNLSWPGTSNDTAFRMAYCYIPTIKPRIVILLSPFAGRMELIRDNELDVRFLPSGQRPDKINEFKESYNEFYQDWLTSDTNLLTNKFKNILAIEKLCSNNNINFLSLEIEEFKTYDHARDLLHKGIHSNLLFANKVLTKI